MLKPWLFLYRRRLILAACVAIFVAIATLFSVAAESPTDFGVLWNHFCGCPLDPDDTRTLLYAPIICAAIIAVILSYPRPRATGASSGSAALQPYRAETAFYFTRPMRREAALITPFALASATVILFPAAAFLALYAWLHAVHAPSLGHVIALLEMLPRAAHLGPQPSLASLLIAIDMPRRYLAAVALGTFVTAIFQSSRWCMLSSNPNIRLLGLSQVFVFLVPMLFRFTGTRFVSALLLFNPGKDLAATPSLTNIAVHLALTGAILFGCWRILSEIEL